VKTAAIEHRSGHQPLRAGVRAEPEDRFEYVFQKPRLERSKRGEDRRIRAIQGTHSPFVVRRAASGGQRSANGRGRPIDRRCSITHMRMARPIAPGSRTGTWHRAEDADGDSAALALACCALRPHTTWAGSGQSTLDMRFHIDRSSHRPEGWLAAWQSRAVRRRPSAARPSMVAAESPTCRILLLGGRPQCRLGWGVC
jgi:hypothetical protein